MSRYGLFNPPVQGGAFLLPPRNPTMTKGVPALWTPDQPFAALMRAFYSVNT